MRLGLIIEGFYEKGKIKRSLEVENFIPWFAENNEHTYVINILEDPFDDGLVAARDAATDKEMLIPIESLDTIYYGITGQKIELPSGGLNALDENLEKILQSFEIFSEYPTIKISNPISTILHGLSKDYLHRLIAAGVPTIETLDITSREELSYIAKSGKNLIVKPKISERGNGSVIASKLDTEEKITDYAERFLEYETQTASDLVSEVRNRQGIIAQEFNPYFVTVGEKKIYFVNGDITVARIHEPKGDKSPNSLEFRKGLVERIYHPTNDERKFVHELSNYLKDEGLDFDYFRADIVGDGTESTTRLSELELINPCSSCGHNPDNLESINPKYPQKDVDNHNNALLQAFKKRAMKEEVIENERRNVYANRAV